MTPIPSSPALHPLVDGQIWLCDYPVRLAGTRFPARMTVVRLRSGRLLVHSPCAITPDLARALAALGPADRPVAHLLAPGNFHALHIPSAQAAFPDAETWICPGTELRNPGLRFTGRLSDQPHPDWAGDIDQVLMQGTRLMREVAMFHRASRTLILVDLIENFSDATPGTGGALRFWFKWVFRMWNRPVPAPEYRLGRTDRPAAARALRRILAWDFQRIVLAHGDLILADARAQAERAWAGFLSGQA